METEKNNGIKRKHPSAFSPGIILVTLFTSVIGVIIGLELIVRIGISTNTSIIGALIAIIISKLPIKIFNTFRDVHSQNLIQTSISGATFSSANSLILPIGIPFVLGRPDLVLPLLAGVFMATIIDVTIMYKSFDSEMFPANEPWPPGIATAETILAIANKGKKAALLFVGAVGGVIGKMFGIPTDLFGVAWIGDFWALTAFGAGAFFIGYAPGALNIDFKSMYLPHGIMIGAGLIALLQAFLLLFKKQDGETSAVGRFGNSMVSMKAALSKGFIAYLAVALLLAFICGLIDELSGFSLVAWVIFAAFSAIASELIVGLSAMHSGWFPGFATALIFLLIGMLMGFPSMSLAILVGFTASTGPAFSDVGYDFKAGWILRGEGKDMEFELEGRKQQYFSEILGIVVAGVMVFFLANKYFEQGLFAPVNYTFKATIDAGASPEVAKYLLMWAVPGAIIQFIGGPSKQLGVLFATGLLVGSTITGLTVLGALAIRAIIIKVKGQEAQSTLYILGAGFLTGAALYSFFTSTLKLIAPKK